MKLETSTSSNVDTCCSAGCSSSTSPVSAAASSPSQGKLFRIATMDCSAEEAEIRRALEPLDGIRSLGFQLGARTLKIDAAESAYQQSTQGIIPMTSPINSTLPVDTTAISQATKSSTEGRFIDAPRSIGAC